MSNQKVNDKTRVKELQLAWYKLRKASLSLLGIIILIMLVFIAVFAPYLAPYPEDVKVVHLRKLHQPPNLKNLFGTDYLGRDILSRCLFGARISLWLSVAVIALAAGIGVPLGLIAGYMGGIVNTIIMRITDIFFTIPSMALALAVSAILSPNLVNAMFAIAITWWPSYTRLVQGEVLSIKEELFVEASQSIGASPLRIMFKDILPNCLSVLMVKCTIDMGFVVLYGAGLSFLGMGAQPPTPEWGAMVAEGRALLPFVWWEAIFPGMMILLMVFAFNLLGDGLRDILEIEL